MLAKIPREEFVPSDLTGCAYDDRALPIDAAQTISQPYIVALMTESLQIEPHHRILEVGTGTGYQTAVLAGLSAHVYSIERIESLSAAAQKVGSLKVEGQVSTQPGKLLRVEFFSGAAGQAEAFLGFLEVTVPASGIATFSALLPATGKYRLGHLVTATATDELGNTSEFSIALTVA